MSKYRVQAIIFVLVAFMLGCNEFIVVGILSDMAKSFGAPVATMGYLVTIFATTYAICTPFVTILTSKFSRYKTLLTLIVIFLIGNTLSGFATSFITMMLARMLTATVAGAIISLIMTFASAIAPRNKRASLVSWIFAGFSIASVFGVPLGTTISMTYGWRYTFFVISVITIITLVLLIFILPRNLEQVSSSVAGQLTLLKDRRIYIAVFLVLFTAAAMYGYYTYIRPLLTTALGFSTASLNWLLFIIGIMSIISNRLSGMLAEHRGLQVMPRFYVADIVLLMLLPMALASKPAGLAILLVLTLIITILNSPIQIHFLNLAEREYPQSIVLASSLNSIFFNFGISLGSATSSLMMANVGLKWISVGAAVFALISLVLAILLNRAVKRRKIAAGVIKQAA
ncbi:MFS transporter [Secundilactobacillus collinoides]|uniref:Arabinose efflux permease n=2 Tax=Secundilactobacillus collinoides TaxID=33960 RepID=A0A0R2B9U3_SECCO|nr:MFS transporter [Secundilactobacillus collinoides]KRM73307.1 arabinose efflux permease [Secundilactobacillus collinoides DSM 20515 = JCM 1123]KZL42564.1 MFS transporter [Secundilactobacillus collinoides]